MLPLLFVPRTVYLHLDLRNGLVMTRETLHDEAPHPERPAGAVVIAEYTSLAITQELGMRPLTERILARREILRA